MSWKELIEKRADLERERDYMTKLAKEEMKLGGSQILAITASNLAICYQMQIDNHDAAQREVVS